MVHGKTPNICSYLLFNIICKFQVFQVHRLKFLVYCSKTTTALLEFYLPESGRVTVGIMPGESLSSLCGFLCRLLFIHVFQFYNCFLRNGKISKNDCPGKKLLSFFKTTKAIFPTERKVAAIQKLNDKFHLFQIDNTQQKNLFLFNIL